MKTPICFSPIPYRATIITTAMKTKKTLSRSARNNPLYLAAFGKASEEERCARCCSHSAKILKHARRKLYNTLLETDNGFDRLRGLVRQSPNYSSNLTLNSKKISEASDDEDEGYDSINPPFAMPTLEEIDTEMDWNSTASDLSFWKEADLSENKVYPMYSSNSSTMPGKGLFDPPSQPVPIPSIRKRQKVKLQPEDDDDDVYHDDSDEDMESFKLKKEEEKGCDYYEDEVEHTLSYEDSDSETDDEDLGRVKPKAAVNVYSHSYKAPSDDDDDDDMISDSWSNKATVGVSDNEESNHSDTDDDLEGLEYESDEEDYIYDTSTLQLHRTHRGLARSYVDG